MSFAVCSGVFISCSALRTLHNAGAGARQLKIMAVTPERMKYHKQAVHRQYDEKGGSKSGMAGVRSAVLKRVQLYIVCKYRSFY